MRIEKMKKNKDSLESLMKQLVTITKELESNSLNLEESLKKYEEGIRIYKQCHDIINSAELKIKVLNDDNCDGGI